MEKSTPPENESPWLQSMNVPYATTTHPTYL